MLYNKVKKGGKTPFLILKYYLLVMLLIQVSSILLSKLKIDNIFLSHFYFVFQFILLSLFYLKLFDEKKVRKSIVSILFLVLLGLGLQYTFNSAIFL